MRWQRDAADVIGETDSYGRYRYNVVVILVPRQCGKTTFVFDLAIGRCLAHPNYQVAYTAQTGHVTTERFGERMSQILSTPLGDHVRTRRSAGTESIAVPSRGSLLKAFPPKDDALRGSALDLVIVDEAQEISEDTGRALDEMILPTFATRPRRQLILIGTAGTARSGYLRRYLDDARAGKSGMALIEYGAPDDPDPADEALWAAVHPGLAAGLTDLDALRQGRAAMGDAGFVREYLNVWTVGVQLAAIDARAWERAALSAPPRIPDRGVTIGFDIAINHAEAAIGAAWRESDGRVHVRLLEQRPGYAWLTERVEALAGRYRAPAVYDGTGPAVHVAVDLEARGNVRDLVALNTADYAAACIGFAADVSAAALTHADQPPLNVAVSTADRRPIGDRWVWNRRAAALPIAPLIAVTLARHHNVVEPPRRKPVARM